MRTLVTACFIAALAASSIFSSVSTVDAQEELASVTLSTGWILAGGSAGLMLADDRGHFEDGGVDVEIVRGYGSADVVTKVASGTYQAGTGYLPALVQAKADNPELDAIAVVISYDASPDAITGPKTSGIGSPQDLPGHTISAQPNSTTMQTFEPFAEAVGIDPSSVEWLEVGPELIVTTVHQGDADAAGQFAASAIASFQKLGYSRDDLFQFKFADYVDNLYGNGLILQKSWAEQNTEAARGVVRAYIRGLIEAREKPEAAIDALMHREPLLTREIEADDLAFSNEHYYFTDDVLEEGVAYHDKDDVRKFLDLLSGPFDLSRTPAVEEIYTDAYLPEEEVRAVPQ